jgi:hypothetical protein
VSPINKWEWTAQASATAVKAIEMACQARRNRETGLYVNVVCYPRISLEEGFTYEVNCVSMYVMFLNSSQPHFSKYCFRKFIYINYK